MSFVLGFLAGLLFSAVMIALAEHLGTKASYSQQDRWRS